jgi:integrase
VGGRRPERGRPEVRQTLQRTKDGLEFLPPKTMRSRRTIALPKTLVTALKDHKGRQEAEEDVAGDRMDDVLGEDS